MTGTVRLGGSVAPSADGNNGRRQRRNDPFLLGARPTATSLNLPVQCTAVGARKAVPVDALWSVIVYDAGGRLQKNQYDAYSLNSIMAIKGADGSLAVQFGGCDGRIPNCLPTMKGLELHGAALSVS